MAAWNGKPVLARVSAKQIPAVSSPSALDGLQAGFMAAIAYAGQHTAIGELRFNGALRDAREQHDYGYSRGFLAGVEAAKAELAALANLIGGAS